jgi:hypothetical protein
MIEHTDFDELQSTNQPSRDELIRLAGFGNLAGVIVDYDHRCSASGKDQLHHLAGMNARAVDRPAKELDELDQSVPRIEQGQTEVLAVARTQCDRNVVANHSRTGEDSAPVHPSVHMRLGGREDGIATRLNEAPLRVANVQCLDSHGSLRFRAGLPGFRRGPRQRSRQGSAQPTGGARRAAPRARP